MALISFPKCILDEEWNKETSSEVCKTLWNQLWPVERIRQREFKRFGMEVLLQLDLKVRNTVFSLFQWIIGDTKLLFCFLYAFRSSLARILIVSSFFSRADRFWLASFSPIVKRHPNHNSQKRCSAFILPSIFRSPNLL